MDEAFTVGKVISVDRTSLPKKVTVNIGKTHPAVGEVDEKYLLTHTGFVTFPDEKNKKYSFWYYPAEKKIYWTKDKGQTTDIWTGTTDQSRKLVQFSFLFVALGPDDK